MIIEGYKNKHEYISDKGIKSVVYLMDCMEGLKQIPEKYFELAIVDPPYFKGVASGNFYGNNVSTTGIKRKQSKSNKWDLNIPTTNYYNKLLKCSIDQIIWGINYFEFRGLAPCGRIVWDKKNDTSTFSKAEIASISKINSVQIFRWLWNGMLQENAKDKWVVNHPSPKPPELYEWLLKNYSQPNDKILDTHLGSGSSRIACQKAGLEFVGFELDDDYFNASVKRFKEFVAQGNLF